MNHDRSYRAAAREAMEARFARSVATCLAVRSESVSPDVAERLRFGREKALEAARRAGSAAENVGVTASGAAIAGVSRWGLRLASVLPLVALVGGLVLIQTWQSRTQISVAAEIDEALLGDDLPLNAYRDPGFSEFLKTPPSE